VIVVVKGLQRSCTNFVAELLKKNFDVEVDTEHKHDLRPYGPRGPIVLCLKNPYAWLASIWRHAKKTASYGHQPAFSTFLRSAFKFPLPDGKFNKVRRPVHAWNEFNEGILNYRGRSIYLVYQESFIFHNNAVKAVRRLAEVLPTIEPKQEIIPARVRLSRGFDPNYYRRRKYMKLYTPADVKYVTNALDPSLMKKLGYSFA
jgi:hypothetical protein